MTSAEFKALRPQFSASTYDARIAVLIAAAPVLDEDRAGNLLNMALSAWVAGELSDQDFAIKYGAGASLGSSNSIEKTVGKVSIKSSTSQSSSSTTAGGKGANANRYKQEFLDYLREFGMGAQAI